MGDLIGLVAVICIFGLPIAAGILLGMKALKNRNEERMGLINQGIIPPDSPKRKSNPNRFIALRNGILLISIGVGVIVGFLCSEYLIIGRGNEFWITGASIVFFMGIGFLIYFMVSQKMHHAVHQEDNDLE